MEENKRLTNTMKSVKKLEKEIIKNYFNNERNFFEGWFSRSYESVYPGKFDVLGYEIWLSRKVDYLTFIDCKKLPDNESSYEKYEKYQVITQKDRDHILKCIKKELREQNRINDFWKTKTTETES